VILVTGGTGFIGRSLTEALKQKDRSFTIYRGRIDEPLKLRAQLTGVEVVVHLASAESRNRIHLLQRVDVEGTERLIDECRLAGVQRIIVISRLSANPNSHFALLRAKGLVERQIRESGIPFTLVRSATLFGRDDRFLNVIAGLAVWSWPFVWVPGKGRVALQPLWVEDLVRCLAACIDRADLVGETIELAGVERIRYAEIVRQVMLTAGMRRVAISPGIKLVRPIATLLFGWWRHPPVTRFAMDRYSVPEVAPLDSVLRYFGFQPSRMGQRVAYLRRSHPGLELFR
jgi:NADH dehydrogenase